MRLKKEREREREKERKKEKKKERQRERKLVIDYWDKLKVEINFYLRVQDFDTFYLKCILKFVFLLELMGKMNSKRYFKHV